MTKALEAGAVRGDGRAVRAKSPEKMARQKRRREVLAMTYAGQELTLRSAPEQVLVGYDWAWNRMMQLTEIEEWLMDIVPSQSWFDAVWWRGETFPPQDPFDPMEVDRTLRRLESMNLISKWHFQRALEVLDRRADPLQMVRRPMGRMRMSFQRSSWDEGNFEDGAYIPRPPRQRLTPPQAVRVEDLLDRMHPLAATFYVFPASPSAQMINRIGMMRGREDAEVKREQRRQRKLERQKREERAIAAGRLPAEGLKVFEDQSAVEGR